MNISREDIERTYAIIQPYIRRTPVIDIEGQDLGLSHPGVTLKLELLQCAGSFKARGAFTHLLTRDVPAAGVVAASGGNHGAAVAYAAMKRRVPARIFVPGVSASAKMERIRACGAELTVVGERYADALAASEIRGAESGALPVHAFDQIETLLGQGTLAFEMSQQAPSIDTLLVAVGGGGLIGGIAAFYAGRIRVIGVEPEGAPTLTAALQAGAPVDAPTGSIAADRVVLVSDASIRAAQNALWDGARVLAEPGGAAAFAALHSGAYTPASGERVGVVISGGNTTVTPR